MEWEYNVFILTLRTAKSNNTTTMLLNEEMSAGMLLMADNLWSNNYEQYLQLQLFNPHRQIINYKPEEYKSQYQIVEANVILEYDEKENWYQFINKLSSNKANIKRVPSDISMPFTCRLLNRDKQTSAIYQFKSRDFLQTAISLCVWFGLDWTLYIDNLHKGNIMYQIL